MNQCQIAVHQAFRVNESDTSAERAFARWVRAVESLVGFKVSDEPFALADEMFASGLSPEEAAGEFVSEPTAAQIRHEELTANNRQPDYANDDDDSALGFDVNGHWPD